jgi:signal transduction histidine kinase
MMKFITTLRSRLVFSHLLVSLISITIISTFAGRFIFESAREDAKSNLEDLAFAAINVLESRPQEYIAGVADTELIKSSLTRLLTADHPGLQFTLYQPDGTPLVDSGSTLPPKATRFAAPEVWQALNNDSGKGEDFRPDAKGVEFLYVAVRIQREAQVAGLLRLGTPLAPAMDSARRNLGLLLMVALLVASGLSLFGWLLANNLARPIQRLTQASERLAQGELNTRVTPDGTQELRRLAETFNTMADRLQDYTDDLRAFVANASHELRTPLTVVKLRTEALRYGALEDKPVAEQFLTEIESEVDRLVRMVNDLLDLSRMEAGLADNQRALLNLSLIASEVFETFNIRASRAGVTLNLDIDPGIPAMMGNEDQLRRVLYNLIENAIKFTPSGGHVDLWLRYLQDEKTIRVLVKDNGPGIAPEHLSHVFERFYRVDLTQPRSEVVRGSGLGLSIAKSIVENHGGKIGVNSKPGVGSTFWAELPVFS